MRLMLSVVATCEETERRPKEMAMARHLLRARGRLNHVPAGRVTVSSRCRR